MKAYKAYIFDLDGTLLDSLGVWEQIDKDFLAARGFDVPQDYLEAICSRSFREAAEYTVARFGLMESPEDLMREWYDMAVFAYGNTVQMKRGAKEYLFRLKERGAKVAVATSSPKELYEPALRNHGIHSIFDVICSTEEIKYGKTRPDIFHLTAERLGVEPSECVVFEDIFAAVRSAKSIGMTVFAVYDKYSNGDWDKIREAADGAVYDFTGDLP